MKLLLHICCAPCSLMCIETLRGDGLSPDGFWYNPNIHPFTEYRSRRNCLRDYSQEIGLKLIEKNDYALRPFIREVAADIDGRCMKCYEMRLGETAKFAKENGYDAFTSSLFIVLISATRPCGKLLRTRPTGSAWSSSIETSAPTLRRARKRPGKRDFICRNTAAVSSLKRSAISKRRKSFADSAIWAMTMKIEQCVFSVSVV